MLNFIINRKLYKNVNLTLASPTTIAIEIGQTLQPIQKGKYYLKFTFHIELAVIFIQNYAELMTSIKSVFY